MAILDSLPGIEIAIKSQGEVLPEYEDENGWDHSEFHVADDKKLSVYVECASDAEFSIQCSLTADFKMDAALVTLGLEVDRQPIADKILKVGKSVSSSTSSSCERVSANEVVRRALRFASIRKIDDADSTRVKSDASAIPGIGEIVVALHRTIEGQVEYTSSGETPRLRQAPSEIAEKALKGKTLSHGVAFGEEKRERREGVIRDHYPDGRKNPVALFCFKYRSREALQQELIIPRSPSPDIAIGPLNPRSENISRNAMSREERVAMLKKEIENIKSEAKDDDEGSSGRKRRVDIAGFVGNGRAYKTSRNSAGSVVVDLTDD